MVPHPHRLAGALALCACSEVLGFEEPRLARDAGSDDAATAAATCSTHADCNELFWDGPYVCRDGSCLDLTTRSCPIALGGESLNDGLPPLLFGAFSVTEGAQRLSHPVTLNYDLVIKDFVRSGGLLVGERAALPIFIVCHGLPETAEELDTSIDHLVDTLEVPGILTPIDQTELLRSFRRVLRDKGRRVLFLSANGSDSLVTPLDDDGLLWHVLPGPLDVGHAYLPLVARIEAYLGLDSPLRVALVTSPAHRFLDDLGTFLRTRLTVGGRPLLEHDQTTYRALALPSQDRDPTADLSFAVAELRAFKPHLIVSAADQAFLGGVLPVLEQNWDQVADGQPPPFYVLSPFQNDPRTLRLLVSDHRSLRTRLVGVNAAGAADSTLYDLYLDRFRAEYPAASDYEGTENHYDAAYWLLYGAVASGAEPPLDGASLAYGITRLLSGPRFDVGPMQIGAASRYLRQEAGASIALHGTLGPPEFDAVEGTRRGTGSVWCVDESLDVRYDALRFDEATEGLTGDFPCFEF